MARPLLVTLGDPGGLGPELALRHFTAHPAETFDRTFGRAVVLVGSPAALAAHARSAAAPPAWRAVDAADIGPGLASGLYLLTPPGVAELPVHAGRASPEGGRAAGLCLEAAAELMLAGQGAALATCPLDKAMLNAAGFAFPGHTEFLARTAGVAPDEVCMHLCGPRLRVSLVTTHPPLAQVPKLVTQEKVLRCARLSCAFTRRLGLSAPVAVCGLNPHAGESGTIGHEEAEVISPALERGRAEGLKLVGPLPADTVFRRAADGEFAAVLAMYHDQGLGPLKLLHFGEAVNVTLGLPFVRTSVDHGTGYDLVGTGRASGVSLRAAVELALRLCPAEDLD